MHIFLSAINIVSKWYTELKMKLLKMLKCLMWITTRLFWFEFSSRSWCKCDVKICTAGVLAVTRWTSAVTAKGRGYGQYQVPHQNCDWNHKTVTDWVRPWPVLTRLAWASQSGSPTKSWPNWHVLFIPRPDTPLLYLFRPSSHHSLLSKPSHPPYHLA